MADREMSTKKQAEFDAWSNDHTYGVEASYKIDKEEVTGRVIELQRREDEDGKFVWGRAVVRVP